MKALWLTSWYPNRLDELNGDFVQRHARATALFCDVHVIHLEPDNENVLTSPTEVSINKEGNLTEEIILYRLSSLPVIDKYFSFRRYTAIFKKSIAAYIQHNGMPDIVHVHVPIKAGVLALWMKKKYGIKYIVTEHWAIYNNSAPDAYSKRNSFFKYFTKKILQQAAMFTPVSNELGLAVQRLVAPVLFTAVPNVVDTNLFNYNGEGAAVNRTFTFLHVSTLKWQKNPQGILKTFSKFLQQHPSSKLIMVGGADDALVNYASSLNIPKDNIRFTGFITYAAVAELMKVSDALVMFSRYENMPCVITEALCCGLPVISSEVGGINEVINDNNGVLIPSEDEAALLEAMLFTHNNYRLYNRNAIASEARSLFCYATVGKQITGIYQQFKNQT